MRGGLGMELRLKLSIAFRLFLLLKLLFIDVNMCTDMAQDIKGSRMYSVCITTEM